MKRIVAPLCFVITGGAAAPVKQPMPVNGPKAYVTLGSEAFEGSVAPQCSDLKVTKGWKMGRQSGRAPRTLSWDYS